MKQEILELHALLDTLITGFGDLTRLFEKEREAIRKREPERLEQIAEVIRQLTSAIHALEPRRMELTSSIAHALGIKGENPSLKEIDQALGGRAQLAAKRDKLRKAIAEADKANQENQAVLKGVTAAAEAFLEIVRKSASTGVGYTRAGTRQTSSDRHIFSKKY